MNYEKPELLDLSSNIAYGAACFQGSAATENCNGFGVAPGTYCAAGTNAQGTPGYCEAGTNASPGYCSSGDGHF